MTDSKPMRAELVDDYRIKCALLLEEVIDAEEAAKLANAENDDLRREVAATTKHAQLLNKMLGEAEARAERLRVALEAARLLIVDQYSTDENADSGEWCG